MKKIWNKIKSWSGWKTLGWIGFWIGIGIILILFSTIVFICAGLLMIISPFLVIFSGVREKLLEDLFGGKYNKSKKEAIIEEIKSSPHPDVEDEDSYYYFSR